jgi:hypothetical protein
MKINEDNKFLSKWSMYEVARYVPSLERVIRDKNKILSINEIPEYAQANGNTGIYTSVFAYDTADFEKATRLGPLYFDIDNKDFEIAKSDCIKLYEHLLKYIPAESILVYFTGKKGFHIECEPIALGISPGNNLPKVFRYIATDLVKKLSLSSLDFSVYDLRRMWRLAGSIHQDTKLHKTLLNPYNGDKNYLYEDFDVVKEYASDKRSLDIAEQSFSYKANEWYRENIYNLEEDAKKKDNPLEYFNKYGSKAFKSLAPSAKVFDKDALIHSCSAIKRLHEQAEQTHYLEHEARLFLCSILTYTEDSIKYLHEILSNCHDYNFEKSSAHINDWIKRRQMGIGGRPYTCDRANSVGVGCGECNLEKKNKWAQIGNKYVETTEKSSPSPIRYAYKTIKKED